MFITNPCADRDHSTIRIMMADKYRYRVEAWEFIIEWAAFMHLNGTLFDVSFRAAGTETAGPWSVKDSENFMYGFDFIRMRKHFLIAGTSPIVHLYVNRRTRENSMRFTSTTRNLDLVLNQCRWVRAMS